MFSYEIELYLVVEMDLYVSLSISLTTVFFFIKSCSKSKIRDTTISEQKKRLLPSH